MVRKFISGFCVNYKDCKEITDDAQGWNKAADGKRKFHFHETGVSLISTQTREELKENCADVHYNCADLIQYDGWEIKDDYPIKF